MTTKTLDKPVYSLLPAWGYVPAAHDRALSRLAGAVIIQAARDALKNTYSGNKARRWLTSQECEDMCILAGLSFRAVCAWVRVGCPKWIATYLVDKGAED